MIATRGTWKRRRERIRAPTESVWYACRSAVRLGSPDLLHDPADLQAELVADFDDLALSDRAIANHQIQGLVAGLVELNDRAWPQLNDFLDALALRRQRHLNRYADMHEA